jgi:hypothetical protein
MKGQMLLDVRIVADCMYRSKSNGRQCRYELINNYQRIPGSGAVLSASPLRPMLFFAGAHPVSTS